MPVSMVRLLALVCLACVALPLASAGRHRSLIVVDDMSVESTHSQFISSLKEQGYDVTVAVAGSDDIELRSYGEFLFDSLVLLCPKAKDFGGDLDEALILEYVDAGNSLIVAGSLSVGSAVRGLVEDCGMKFDSRGTVALDHAAFHSLDEGTHTLFVADNFSKSKILGSATHKPVLFEGVAISVDSANPLTTPLLRGSPTTYSANPEKVLKADTLAGASTVLVAAVQTLTRGRILVSGSLDLFSNRFMNAEIDGAASGNSAFVRETVGWALQQRGILRAHSVYHRKQDGSELFPRTYRVKDDVYFSVVIEELDGLSGEWKPFHAEDVQVEFRMLDPYVRTGLTSAGNGTFSTEFRVPDHYGVFKFAIDYRRDGYSHIVLTQEVGVRPFRHNEFERFIVSAYPYYAAAFTSMGGFVLFSIVFLFTKDGKEKRA